MPTHDKSPLMMPRVWCSSRPNFFHRHGRGVSGLKPEQRNYLPVTVGPICTFGEKGFKSLLNVKAAP